MIQFYFISLHPTETYISFIIENKKSASLHLCCRALLALIGAVKLVKTINYITVKDWYDRNIKTLNLLNL